MSNRYRLKTWTGVAGIFVVLALVIVFAISSITPPPVKDDAEIISGQRTAIEDIVRGYLLKNPEIVRESLLELERRDQVAEAETQRKAIINNRDQIFSSSADFVTGNPDGDVTLVEFFDYNCGFCRRAVADLVKLLAEDPNLRVVLKEFPVLSQGSIEAARLSMAAIKQGRYMEFHKALFAMQGAVNGARALELAARLGLDAEALKSDADMEDKVAVISDTLQIATELGINGTPSYIIGEQLVIGAVGYDQLKTVIDAERARLKAGS